MDDTYSLAIKDFIFRLEEGITNIINDDLVGLYLHGSLAIGGFNLKHSDVDIIAVTNQSLTVENKREIAKFFLRRSNSSLPIEISFLNTSQLTVWQHPCPFDFHYSEYWRERYIKDLKRKKPIFLTDEIQTDPDLAAHITILHDRGICVRGEPISEVFPTVPRSDYESAILGDFEDCLVNMVKDPIYSVLNSIRVYWYLKEGVISSKQEAGNWGLMTFPNEMLPTIKKVVDCYENDRSTHHFEVRELELLKRYILHYVQKLAKL